MKRRIWITLAVCLTVLVILTGCLVGWISRHGLAISECYYMETLHGHMVVLDGSPVAMSGEERLFQGLTTGDRVIVIHGIIAESYPGQAEGYFCFKQADGTQTDIPARVRASMKQMGWLPLPFSSEEAEALAHLYTGYCFSMATAAEDPETGDWTVVLRDEDAEYQETVRFSADGKNVTIASGMLYR